ncbi:MAG: hypothetical protein WC449_06350 [Candidatus Paceibacterota bacterium]
MTDLNTAIAFQRGWQIINHHGKKWNLIGTQTIQENAPDFEHDARLYMALFEEMGKETDEHEPYDVHLTFMDGSFTVAVVDRGYNYEDDDYTYNSVASADGDTIGTAICLAYCKLKGIEVVG